jgi:molecular chaperone GrpE
MEDTLHAIPEPQENDDAAMPEDGDRLLKERDEYLDGWQRARAELANYRREESKRFDEMMKFANNALIRELIAVLDNFELAILSMERHGEVEKGIYLIKVQLEDILKQSGLERMNVEVGQQFDPSVHEAIVSVESDLASGSVVEEVERGYYLQGKLIRPARVKVSQ